LQRYYYFFRYEMKNKINFILTICVLALVVICFVSVNAPMQFEEQRAQREQDIKARLITIRKAEEAYLAQHGRYTDSFDSLVAASLLPDTMRFIPHAEGETFQLATAIDSTQHDTAVPLVECRAPLELYLKGLSESEIANLMKEAERNGQYAGLKFGSITTPNNNAANWE